MATCLLEFSRTIRWMVYNIYQFKSIICSRFVLYGLLFIENYFLLIYLFITFSFLTGISQVLYAMAVIELAKPGQEAITYELIVSAGNSAGTLNSIIATQLTYPTNSAACKADSCDSGTVDVTSESSYFDSDGPRKWTNYTFIVLAINIVSVVIFTQFLPTQKKQCHEWKREGEEKGEQRITGYLSVTLASIVILYVN